MRDRNGILPLDAAQGSVVRRDLRFGDILAAEGKLDRAGIEQVIRLQESRGVRFGEAALRLQLITLEDLRAALAKQYDYPYLPADARPPNPQELLLRPALTTFLQLARNEYDVILIDTPPARENADAQSVAFSAGSVLVLARANHTRIDDAAGLVRDFRDAGALVVGTALNRF